MKPEALIFDIDGTLWDSRELVARGYNRYLCSIGRQDLQVDAQYLTGLFGKTVQEIADLWLSSIPAPDRYDIIHACMASEQALMHADPCQVAYPGVRETLEALAREYRLFLVSNCEQGYPELLLEKLDVGHLITGHLCHGDTRKTKGETIRLLMERHGISSAVYIGDTEGDRIASADAGIPFVWCSYGFGNPTGYHAKIHTMAQLPEILQKL